MLGKFGESSHGHDPVILTRSFLTMSNDAFHRLYGFNWVPPEFLVTRVRRQLHKEYEKRIAREFQLSIIEEAVKWTNQY